MEGSRSESLSGPRGFRDLSAAYRLAPGATFPAQFCDGNTAVHWGWTHASELGADPPRIGGWGVSADGHLAGLLETTAHLPEWKEEERSWPEKPTAVQAVGNICGVMDFLDPTLSFGAQPRVLFGGPGAEASALAASASPVTHVSAQSAPFLHLHGRHSRPLFQVHRMHAALTEKRGRSAPMELGGDHFIIETHVAEIEKMLLAFSRRELRYP